jgi:4-amino-4-deoxy-L-arabinose transferase-like glycosyltransferase
MLKINEEQQRQDKSLLEHPPLRAGWLLFGTPRWWCCIIFAAALCSRLFFVLFSSFEAGDQTDYTLIANHLARNGQFALHPDSPTIYRPPGYPFFLAFISFFTQSNEAVWLVQAAIGALAGVFVYLILRFAADEGSARLAALMAALYPHLSFYAGTILSETILSAALVLATYCVYRSNEEHTDLRRLRFAAGAGVLAAITVLLTPRFVIVPLLAAIALWCGQSDKNARRKSAFCCLVSACLMLAPWTVRNYLVFRVISPSALQSPGFQFWLAAKQVAVYDYQWATLRSNEPLMQRHDVLYRDRASERKRFPERVALERALFNDALATIAADPVGFLLDRGRKYPRLWIQPAMYAGYFHPPFSVHNLSLGDMISGRHYGAALMRVATIIIFVFVPAVLVLAGIVVLWPQRRRHAMIYLLFFWVALVQAPFYIEHRYTVVMHPLLAVFCAAAWQRLTRINRPRVAAPGNVLLQHAP